MKISENAVVTFGYKLYEFEGELLESADEGSPASYLHGHFNILPALELAFEGRQKGETFTKELSAKLAYGERRAESIVRFPIKKIETKSGKRLVKGAHVWVNTDQHGVDGVIVKLGKFNADVDTNHPMAGKALRFEIEIYDVREAEEIELAHGHVHGPGGHHH